MKKIMSGILSIVMLLSLLSMAGCAEEKEGYKKIFEKDKVIDINIEIDESDLNDIYNYAENEEYHSADITVDGVKVENAGIRTKGNMTLKSVSNSDSNRYSYRIKFDKYVKGNSLLGLDELCLNNGYSDPSYMREYLHYEILRELGMNVPETVFCNLYINGEKAGLYLAVEGLDDTFLEDEFGENYKEGNFYKMDEGATLEYKENEDYSYADLKSGDDTELEEFKNFIKKLNNVKTGEKGDIESFLNVDSALKYIASNTVLCNYDSYSGNMHHNYYLYENENGVFTVVPWDFNMSFGGFNGKSSEVGIDTPYTSGSLETLPLMNKLLSVPEYKEKYYGYIKEIMGMLENFESRVSELKSVIGPYVENDPTAFYSAEEFEKATAAGSENEKNTVQEQKTNSSEDRQMFERGGKGGMGSVSIIDCVNDRIANLEKQFSGEAEKTTTASGGRGENRRPGKSETNENGADMPEMNGERPEPPEMNGDRPEMPEMNGDRPEMPEMNGGRPEPPEMNGDRPEMPELDGNRPELPGTNGNDFKNGGMDNKGNNKKQADSPVRVHVNGHIISFSTEPYAKNDTTLVGFRSILEALGAEVTWNNETETVTAVKDGTTVSLKVGDKTAYVNGKEKELIIAPEISEGSLMVPVRFVSEQLGMKVSWDENTKLITVVSK